MNMFRGWDHKRKGPVISDADWVDVALRAAAKAGKLPRGFLWGHNAELVQAKFQLTMMKIFGYAPPDAPKRNVRQPQARRQLTAGDRRGKSSAEGCWSMPTGARKQSVRCLRGPETPSVWIKSDAWYPAPGSVFG
jgi:hypothetical protein